MADIFLSYAHEDLAKAEQLASALEKQGWTVFWDISSILAGQDFDDIIEKAINTANCMIVLWSDASKKSHYVRDEARKGRDRNILVPILVEPINPPMGFGSLHTENFAAWSGDLNSYEFNKLHRAVARLVGSGIGLDQTPADNAKSPPSSFPKQETSGSKTSVVSNITFIEPEMVVLPAGFFQMGSNRSKKDQRPIHLVYIAQPFLMSKYLITFGEYELFVKANNLEFTYDQRWSRKRPVIGVSWEDACAYASWLSEVSRKSYRLPSESEWEYAARADTESAYYWGNNANDADNFAWFDRNSESKTHPVGEKRPNAFGLYDMAGNVWEWLQDCWHENYLGAPTDGKAWQTKKKANCTRRVVRGGSYETEITHLRSANRLGVPFDKHLIDCGFRLVRD